MKLTIDSICTISKLVDKLQPDEDFIQQLFEIAKTANGKDKKEAEQIQTEIGIKIVMKLGTKLHSAKDELLEFISAYKGISAEEAKEVNIVDLVKEIMQDEDLKSFLQRHAMSNLKK